MTDHQATPEQWHGLEKCINDSQPWAACILELRSRVETLEAVAHKHIVETSANILALASRVEELEAASRPTSKVYEISEPLQLSPEQAQQFTDLLTPNSKPTSNPSQIRSSLVKRVHSCIVGEPECGHMQARAAIREVAAWLQEQHDGDLVAATVLEREAER